MRERTGAGGVEQDGRERERGGRAEDEGGRHAGRQAGRAQTGDRRRGVDRAVRASVEQARVCRRPSPRTRDRGPIGRPALACTMTDAQRPSLWRFENEQTTQIRCSDPSPPSESADDARARERPAAPQ